MTGKTWRTLTQNAFLVGVEGERPDEVSDFVISGERVGVVVEFDDVQIGIPPSAEICEHDGLAIVGQVRRVEDEMTGGRVDDGAYFAEIDFFSGVDADV